MRLGFTLLEVVVAVMLLGTSLLAAIGTVVAASRRMTEAERLEHAVAAAEGVLDSLDAGSVADGWAEAGPFRVTWSVVEGRLRLEVLELATADTLLQIRSAIDLP